MVSRLAAIVEAAWQAAQADDYEALARAVEEAYLAGMADGALSLRDVLPEALGGDGDA